MNMEWDPFDEYYWKNPIRYFELILNKPIKNFACTPKQTVWRKNKTKLYRYKTGTPRKFSTPILCLYALINKPTLLDLMPGQSLVEHLSKSGFDVYLLDWGTPNLEDKDIGFSELVIDYIDKAVKRVLKISESPSLNLLGYCMGGTMAAMYAGLADNPLIKNLILMASPISFQSAGVSSVWLQSNLFDADRVVKTFDVVPAEFIDNGARMLKPVANFYGKYTRLWRMLWADQDVNSWVAVNKWAEDGIPFPGQAYREWIEEMYQQDALVNGKFQLRGQPVDLKNINCPLLVLAGSKDHLVLPAQSEAIIHCVSSADVSFKALNTGHGGLAFGNTAVNQAFPFVTDWLSNR